MKADLREFERVRQERRDNDPPIRPGQIWVTNLLRAGEPPMRRIRILAEYPYRDFFFKNEEDRLWLYENLPGGQMRYDLGAIGRCPEFNLRYVYRLEDDETET